jgi:multisubunit Na+/H+ antiporter MnhG subunit
MRTSINRLHFLSASSTLGPILIAAAVVTKQSLESMGVKAVLVAGILGVTGPILTHAMANAIRVRERGGLDVRPTEEVSAP